MIRFVKNYIRTQIFLEFFFTYIRNICIKIFKITYIEIMPFGDFRGARTRSIINKTANKALYLQNKRAYQKLNKRQVTQVKRVVNRGRELKYRQGESSSVGEIVTSGGTLIGTPFDVPQGVTDITRVGDRLQWAGKIDVRISFYCADSSNLVRFGIVQWHPTSTATPSPTINDLFLAGPSASVDVHSQYSHDNRPNFKILLDRTIQLVSVAGAANATTTSVTFRRYLVSLKKAKKDVQYQGSGLQGTNRIFLFYISDSIAITHPTIVFTTKIFFRDA